MASPCYNHLGLTDADNFCHGLPVPKLALHSNEQWHWGATNEVQVPAAPDSALHCFKRGEKGCGGGRARDSEVTMNPGGQFPPSDPGAPTLTPGSPSSFPIMFRPRVWRGPHKCTSSDMMDLVRDKFRHHLRGWNHDRPDCTGNKKALAQCEYIIMNTMSVDTRYLVRPTEGLKVICCKAAEALNNEQINETLIGVGGVEVNDHDVVVGLVFRLADEGAAAHETLASLEYQVRTHRCIWIDRTPDEAMVKNSGQKMTLEDDDKLPNGICLPCQNLYLKKDERNCCQAYVNVFLKKNDNSMFDQDLVPDARRDLSVDVADLPSVGETFRVSAVPSLCQNCDAQTQVDVHLRTALNALVGVPCANSATGPNSARGILHDALDGASLSPSDVNFLVVTQHSPGPFPGVAAHLLSLPDRDNEGRLLFSPTCKQYFLPASAGCAGGTIGMDLIRSLLVASPAKTALLVNIELCSLGFRPRREGMSWLLNAGLFGDAITATVFRGARSVIERPRVWRGNSRRDLDFARSMESGPDVDPPASRLRIEEECGLEMVESLQRSVPDAVKVSGFVWDPEGYHFITTQQLCNVVADNVPAFCAEMRIAADFRSVPVLHVVHPGGAAMIRSMEESGVCTKSCVEAAKRSLADGGNVASCSVMEIISRRWVEGLIHEGGQAPREMVCVAMGPGFVMCGVAFRSWAPSGG